jgi:hypothetical protein
LNKEFPEAMQVLRPKNNIEEQLTKPNNNSILTDYTKIIFTGDTQPLGLSKVETPKTFIYKINNNPNFGVSVFPIQADGYQFPVYRLVGKGQYKGKQYEIALRPEKDLNFALIGTIKIPIK